MRKLFAVLFAIAAVLNATDSFGVRIGAHVHREQSTVIRPLAIFPTAAAHLCGVCEVTAM